MTSSIDPSSDTLRIRRLGNLSQAIQNRKGRTDAFNALYKEDRIRILAKLKIPRFDWTTIEKKHLKQHVNTVILKLTSEIRFLQTRKNPLIDHVPDVLLHLIFKSAAVNPATISIVCKKFHNAQESLYKTIFTACLHDQRLNAFTKGLTLKSNAPLKSEKARVAVKKMYLSVLQAAREQGILFSVQTNQHLLMHLGRLAQRMRLIIDNDLLTFYYQLLFTYPTRVNLPDLSATTDISIKATSVRQWMENHRRDILNHVTDLNLANRHLQTLPPEVLFLTQLKTLNLENNELRKLPAGLAKLPHLTCVTLSNNQLTEIPHAFKHKHQVDLVGFEKNPINFEDAIYGTVLTYISIHELNPSTRNLYLCALEQILVKLSKKKDKMPIQDCFSSLIKKIEDTKLQNFFELCLLVISMTILFRAWHAPNHRQMVIHVEQLPKQIRHRIYAFTYFLEKKAGTVTTHKDFGRVVFRDEKQRISHPDIRIKAIQLAYLETAYVKLFKLRPEIVLGRESQSFLKQFDVSFRLAISQLICPHKKEWHSREPSPKEICLARIEAIACFIKDIAFS